MSFRLGRRTWLVTLLAIVLISLTALPAAATYPGTNGQIAFTRYDATGSHVFIANPDGGNPKQLPADDADIAVWSPGGSQILLTICCPSGPPRPAIINADGTGFNLLSVPGLPADGAVSCRAWSPDASQLLCQFMGDTDHSLDGIDSRSFAFTPRWSPDGSKIIFSLFTTTGPGTGDEGISTANADGSGLSQVTSGGGYDFADWGTHPPTG
jgi:hypothetical protein